MKERKKYGLKAARRAPQFSKDNYLFLEKQNPLFTVIQKVLVF